MVNLGIDNHSQREYTTFNNKGRAMVTWTFNKATKLADISVNGKIVKSVKLGDVQTEVNTLRGAITAAVAPTFVAKPFKLGQYHFGASKGL